MAGVLLLGAAGTAAQTGRLRLGREQKTLYGTDDRLDEREVTDAAMLQNGAATAAFVDRESLSLRLDSGGGAAVGSNYHNRYSSWTLDYEHRAQGGLCPGVDQYADQPLLASCSGTLIGPNLIATAGHCLAGDTSAAGVPRAGDMCRPGPCAAMDYVVFDFTSDSDNVFPAANVYQCQEVLHCVVDDITCGEDSVTVDWAVIRLDRAVSGRLPAQLRSTAIAEQLPVYVIGHPSGLPRKYTAAHGASVLSTYSTANGGVGNFISNVDSFAGNSGSGLFDGDTHEFVGIFVSGGDDWDTSGGCAAPYVCTMSPLNSSVETDGDCVGELAVSVDVLRPFIQPDTCTTRADCSGHGDCVRLQSPPWPTVCRCEAGFYAPDCSFVCDRAYCNNRGECTGWNECSCDNGVPWPQLCSVPQNECGAHADCVSDAYCSVLDAGTATEERVCWECVDCDGITCEEWSDSVDGDCSNCAGSSELRPTDAETTPGPPSGSCGESQFENTPSTPTTDRECLSFSECAGGQYEEKPPSPLTDRQCSDVTACNDEEYEVVAPTQTSDRECFHTAGSSVSSEWQEYGGSMASDPRVAIGAVGFVAGMCCMCLCLQKLKRRHETKNIHRTEMGVGQYTEDNPVQEFGAENATPAGTSPGGARP